MMRSQFSFVLIKTLIVLFSSCGKGIEAFTVTPLSTLSTNRANALQHADSIGHQSFQRLSWLDHLSSTAAGNFEWEADDTEAEIDFMDQGVDNPYKKADLMDDNGTLKIDPARLLSPRMNGSNLYLVGMMGSGKSAVGRIIAKRM